MSKLGNNPLLKGASGMLGNVIVFRQQNGKLIMANRPKKRETLTDQQKIAKAKFLQAVKYAKAQMLDPIAKAEYQSGVTENLVSAYAVAVTDYLTGPEVVQVDAHTYAGAVGDIIYLQVFDNFKVTEVTVELRSALDVLIEQGNAQQDPDNPLLWYYTATQANAGVQGSKVIVRAKDKPNNLTVQEVVL
jgi:hypothetical protein